MLKTSLYLLILAILGVAIYMFIWRTPQSPYSGEAAFTLKDTAAIGKIFIASADGESITINKTPSGWLVNNKYKALNSMREVLFYTLYNQATLYPVTQNAVPVVVKNMATDAIKVEVYGIKGEKLKVF
ncbi:MAG: hypothetical protein EBX41_02155, partial [Chitinophagia bacterium]|nr:hypothetical protein [Chitinophagia bacterium]